MNRLKKGMLIFLCLFCALSCGFVLPETNETTYYCQLQEHIHTSTCYKQPASDDMLESEIDSVLEPVLICTKQEHTHSLQCTSNPDADVMDVNQEIAALSLSTLDMQTKVQKIAQHFIGYKESTKNFLIAEDDTIHGYSAFGAWNGSPYEDWNIDFTNCILTDAGFEGPLRSNIQEEFSALEQAGFIKEESSFEAGDLLFFYQDQKLYSAIALSQASAAVGDYEDEVKEIPLSGLEIVGVCSLYEPKNVLASNYIDSITLYQETKESLQEVFALSSQNEIQAKIDFNLQDLNETDGIEGNLPQGLEIDSQKSAELNTLLNVHYDEQSYSFQKGKEDRVTLYLILNMNDEVQEIAWPAAAQTYSWQVIQPAVNKAPVLAAAVENVIEKSAKIVSNSAGIYTVQFQIVINPSGQKLTSGTQTLTLSDTLDFPDVLSEQFNLNSIKLYEYDPSAQNNLGQALADSTYSYTYDQSTHALDMSIPDELAMVLVYESAFYNPSATSQLINNYADLSGFGQSSSQIWIEASTSYTQGTNIQFYKVDKNDYDIRLGGVEFELSQYYLFGYWNLVETFTSNDQGEIVLDQEFCEQNISYNTLYRFEETSSPQGYEIDNGEGIVYFVILNGSSSESEVRETLKFLGVKSDILDQIQYLPQEGGQFFIENTPISLNVSKTWIDYEGNSLSDDQIPVDGVEIALFESTTPDIDAATQISGSEVQLNSYNNWSYTYSGLSQMNDYGQKMYYYVRELTEGQWTTTYSNSSGESTGSILITNQIYPKVSLPQAGVKSDLIRNLKITAGICFGGGSVLIILWFEENKRKKAAR
jgi:hypothetical protein